MKTKHPIFKAYKDGELIPSQSEALGLGDDVWSAEIDPKFCDDLRLFTGFEDCHGEPIYGGDMVYMGGADYFVNMFKGKWMVCTLVSGICMHELYDCCDGLKVSLTPPREERRLEDRRCGNITRRAVETRRCSDLTKGDIDKRTGRRGRSAIDRRTA